MGMEKQFDQMADKGQKLLLRKDIYLSRDIHIQCVSTLLVNFIYELILEENDPRIS